MPALVSIVGAATVYDLWAWRTRHETLTCAFKRCRDKSFCRYLLGGAIGALVVHLFEE